MKKLFNLIPWADMFAIIWAICAILMVLHKVFGVNLW